MHTASSGGFTMVEALVAMAIVMSGVLGLVHLTRQVTDLVAGSRRHLVAAWLADARVARLSQAPFAATPANCLQHDIGGCVETLDGHGRPTAIAPAFVRRWRVVPLAGGGGVVWVVAACVVPAARRGDAGTAPGACVARLVHEVWP